MGKIGLVRVWVYSLVVAFAALAVAQVANANIWYSVRPASGDSLSLTSTDTSVTLDVYAVITNSNSSILDEGFGYTFASFKSNDTGYTNKLKGNITAGAFDAFIDGGGSTGTSGVDLDGDGDFDLGSNDASNAAGWWNPVAARHGSSSDTFKVWYANGGGNVQGIESNAKVEFHLGQVNFSLTQAQIDAMNLASETTYTTKLEVGERWRTSISNKDYQWSENMTTYGAVNKAVPANNAAVGTSNLQGDMLYNGPITITYTSPKILSTNDSVISLVPSSLDAAGAKLLAGTVPVVLSNANHDTTFDLSGTVPGLTPETGTQLAKDASVIRTFELPYGNTLDKNFVVTNVGNGAGSATLHVNVNGAGEATVAGDAFVAGNKLSLVLPAGAAINGLKSKTDKVVDGVNGALGNEAIIVQGTATGTVSMNWRARTSAEKGLTSPSGLPHGVAFLASDVVDVTGTGSNPFVLQMSYDASLLTGGADEITLAKAHLLGIGWLNGSQWEFIGSGNPIERDYTGTDGLTPGTWGINAGQNTVWVVTDHNSQFAVVPEPGTIALLGVALAGLAMVWFRRKRA